MEQSKLKVAIIDYGIGNLFSVERACEKVGIHAFVSGNKAEVDAADAVILPGVGAFGAAMKNLQQSGMLDSIQKFAASGKYMMGICLGMQLLMDKSEEFGDQRGLGIIPGNCTRFSGKGVKVPQIMWNKIYAPGNKAAFDSNTPLSTTSNNEFMYFVHSYYVVPEKTEHVLSLTSYNNFEYCSSVQKDNIFGFQFHPEKSGPTGLNIYENFKQIIESNL